MEGPTSEPDATLIRALVRVGQWLKAEDYRFVTVTPATHAAVLARAPNTPGTDWRDVFGWNRPFQRSLLPGQLMEALESAALVEPHADGTLTSRVRFATLDGHLFAHSAYPTVQSDAVFFGPDTYRFARLLQRELARQPLGPRPRILDVGCGSGAAGILAAADPRLLAPELVLSDISPRALVFARAGAELAGVQGVQYAQGDLFKPVAGTFDLVVANPPYLNDATERTYRHGGGSWGGALSERIVREGLERLRSGGRLVLYTGAVIARGKDTVLDALQDFLQQSGCAWEYAEIDPDVFGEELRNPAYAGAERIAAISLVVLKP